MFRLAQQGEYYILVHAYLHNILYPLYSVLCTSGNTSQHANPVLDIENGAVSIPSSYIQNDWPNSTTLNAPRGLAESGLQGYYTCRTEGDTFLSHHILHSSKYSTYRTVNILAVCTSELCTKFIDLAVRQCLFQLRQLYVLSNTFNYIMYFFSCMLESLTMYISCFLSIQMAITSFSTKEPLLQLMQEKTLYSALHMATLMVVVLIFIILGLMCQKTLIYGDYFYIHTGHILNTVSNQTCHFPTIMNCTSRRPVLQMRESILS